jgi:hypothetical protein
VAEKSKPNLVYVAVLAVAGGGLAFDRFVLSAKASDGEQAVSNVQEGPADQRADHSVTAVRKPLAERFNAALAQLPPPVLRRQDAFSKPIEAIVESAAAIESKSPAGAGFASRHKLTSVLSQKSGDLAVVDGQLIKIGDLIEGLELVLVEKDGAVFRSGDTEIRLLLARPGLDR